MKIALAHDWLNTKFGGAEQVLRVLTELYPDAPIYTLVYNQSLAGDVIPKSRVVTSSLQSRPAWLKARPRYLLPLIPSAVEELDFSGFDLVISSSGAWMKNLLTPTETSHLCYCHSPMRFVWDYWPAYLDEQRKGPLTRFAIRQLTSYLRVWDFEGAARVDHFLANSETTRARIQKYYRRDSRVVYPPVELSDLKPGAKKEDFLLAVGSLTPYKKFDLSIEAARSLGRKLIIVGDGPDRTRLEQLAKGANVEFRGYAPRAELAHLYTTATALLHPQVEDFGITVVESLAAGTPVVAYRAGGAVETLTADSGIFFDQQTSEALAGAIKQLDKLKFDPKAATKHAGLYSTEAFKDSIRLAVADLVRS